MDRRRFLTVLGTTGAGAAVLSGCSTDRVQKLIPYLVQSEDQIPGLATYYATTCSECADGCGVHVRTREGRAVFLEGNPEHPINRGKLCSRGQAALQGLYNPGRLKGPMARNAAGGFDAITWDDAIQRLAAKLTGGGRLAVISGAGPGTLDELLGEWTAALGGTLVRYEAFDYEPFRAANRAMFGRDELPVLDVGEARYIVSFGADFLETWLSPLEHARGYAKAHGFVEGTKAKHVAFASRMALSGLNADEWYTIRPGSEAVLALAMANIVAAERGGMGGVGASLAQFTPEMAAKETGLPAETIRRVARELAAASPSLAVPGGISEQHQGAVEVCAAVNLLNYVAGNIGRTVRFGARAQTARTGERQTRGVAALEELGRALDAGQVAVLLVHEANPLYTLPAAAGFGAKFQKAGFKVSTSMFLDETAAQCDLILPDLHALERWGDAWPRAGVRGLMQPVMEPVFGGLPTGDVLLRVSQKVGGSLAAFTAPSFEAYLKTRWQRIAAEQGAGDFDAFWRSALQRGGLYTETPTADVQLAAGFTPSYTPPRFDGDGEFFFAPHVSPHLYDGRGANKPWLLEIPDPVSKITWHAWAEVHPTTAARLDVRNGEIVRLTSPHGAIEVPVYIYPGVHPDVISVPLGFGHTEYGAYAKGRGPNALDLLAGPGDGGFVAYAGTRVAVTKTGGYRKLATTEGNPRQLGRGIAQAMPLAAAAQGLTLEEALTQAGHPPHEFNTEREKAAIAGWGAAVQQRTEKGDYAGEQPRWGMAIDLSRCTGCSACITACYAENNIPIVGEEEVLRGREMTWIRIERYWEDVHPTVHAATAGSAAGHGESQNAAGHGGTSAGAEAGALEARFVPMLCQHCGNAPCEPVCPVYAAYHTPDGLNGQVYNRCVGTRYCANNCPYKVRYFNWYKYNERSWPEPLNLQLNPDVVVRARGVMEKCTFCVQRIRGAQNAARLEGRPLRDGDVTTACASVCPSDAIVFGDLNDPNSRVRALADNPRGYHVLKDLNTRPAITYLAKVLVPTEA